jgi:hypothetical protein
MRKSTFARTPLPAEVHRHRKQVRDRKRRQDEERRREQEAKLVESLPGPLSRALTRRKAIETEGVE